MSEIVGQKIVKTRNLTKKEIEVEGWDIDEPVSALELEDGTLIYPSSDDEGNGCGALFGTKGATSFRIL